MADQHSALRVKLSDIIEGMDLQSDECFSYLNTATGEVISVTTEELRVAEEEAPLEDFPDWQHEAIRIARDIVETDHYLPCRTGSKFMNTRSWSGSVSQWMMMTCGMICVTPYVVEEHSGVSKTGCRRMVLPKTGTGIVMSHYERWR